MKEILCWLGIHKWINQKLIAEGFINIIQPGQRQVIPTGEKWFQYSRECEDCHKVNIYSTN